MIPRMYLSSNRYSSNGVCEEQTPGGHGDVRLVLEAQARCGETRPPGFWKGGMPQGILPIRLQCG
nr:hypothetical protein [Candidatus Sigynarchaeota archaeon]